MEAALQCIREKSGEIDIDADEIDAKVRIYIIHYV